MTAQIARASNPGGTTPMWVRDRLDGLWRDEDLAGWYPRDGRPGISPAQLATVGVLQFLLGLSDRQAAEAVRCRIDFKYAMAMELDDPGFHHSVLADFRERPAQDDRADRLLDPALERLKEPDSCTSAPPSAPTPPTSLPRCVNRPGSNWSPRPSVPHWKRRPGPLRTC
ncbi:transposase [Kitasatospora cineracea]|uniref:transposase n=1 Tax=Kitasatospora cineracea TaxID=88074 RepID=UPI00378F3B8A